MILCLNQLSLLICWQYPSVLKSHATMCSLSIPIISRHQCMVLNICWVPAMIFFQMKRNKTKHSQTTANQSLIPAHLKQIKVDASICEWQPHCFRKKDKDQLGFLDVVVEPANFSSVFKTTFPVLSAGCWTTCHRTQESNFQLRFMSCEPQSNLQSGSIRPLVVRH